VTLLLIYGYRTAWQVWPHLFQTGGDFEWYYRAAGEILAGRSPFLPGFDYPPLVVVLVLPFHALGLSGARVAWFLCNQACLVAAGFVLFRALGGNRRAGWTIALFWALTGAIPENLAIGQVQPVLLLLLCLAWRWDTARPEWAAAAIGVAAAVKLWPGMLLAAYLGRDRRRALARGIGVSLAAVLVPLAAIAALLPPPHLPEGSDYWMGTPASLNFSVPALILRATDPEYTATKPPPQEWERGNNPAGYELAPERRRLSAAVAVGTLLLGGLALAGLVRAGRAPEPLALLAALTALATLASPISWYHYQIFHLPAFALLAVRALDRPRRARAWARLALVGVLAVVLTRMEVRDLAFGGGSAAEILWGGALITAANLVLFALLLVPGSASPDPSRPATAVGDRIGTR
jgi:alpha-1,2-mannosyltransferase